MEDQKQFTFLKFHPRAVLKHSKDKTNQQEPNYCRIVHHLFIGFTRRISERNPAGRNHLYLIHSLSPVFRKDTNNEIMKLDIGY
jgi:hypothetical protein